MLFCNCKWLTTECNDCMEEQKSIDQGDESHFWRRFLVVVNKKYLYSVARAAGLPRAKNFHFTIVFCTCPLAFPSLHEHFVKLVLCSLAMRFPWDRISQPACWRSFSLSPKVLGPLLSLGLTCGPRDTNIT